MKKITYFAAVAVALLALVLLPMNGRAQVFLERLTGDCPDIEVVDEFDFPFPGESPDYFVPTVHGLAFRKFDRTLWGAEFSMFSSPEEAEGKIHKFRVNNGDLEIVKTIDVPGFDPTGITFGYFRLWFASVVWDGTQNITRICKVGTLTGRIIRCFDAPGGDSTGLTFVKRERVLWNAGFGPDGELGYLYKINPRNGDLLLTVSSPGEYPEGLTNDGRNLWHVDWDSNMLYKMDMDANVVCSWDGPGIKPGGFPGQPIGLTFDRRTHHLWLSDQGTRMIYKLDVGYGEGDD